MKNMIPFKQSFVYKLCDIAKKYPHYQALYVDGQSYSYAQLFHSASLMASQFLLYDSDQVAILAGRNFFAYASILGCWLAGKVYVPLHNKDSVTRLKNAYQLSGARLIFTDDEHQSLAETLCNTSGHIIYATNIENALVPLTLPNWVNENAYLMFTSGSSGMPKAVMIRHDQLVIFIENITKRCGMHAQDRFSQITEFSFDFSIYEIFACWFVAASLYVLPDRHFLALTSFLCNHQITFFACVPSTVLLLKQCKKLQHNIFPALRYTIFCGEALTNNIAKLWHNAAPTSVIDNLYGPTEATVALSGYRWSMQCGYDIVPIGKPFPGQKFMLHHFDQARNRGELLLSGSQVIHSYWQQQQNKHSQFIHINDEVWYSSGDLASFDSEVGYIFAGRLDDQLKIRGYRVEKLEIEVALKNIAKTEAVAVVCVQDAESSQLHAYIAHTVFSQNELFEKIRLRLPDYMVPNRIFIRDSLPYNKNGKIDYQNLSGVPLLSAGFIDVTCYDKKRQKNIGVAVWYPSAALADDHLYRKHYQGQVAFQGAIVSGVYPLLLFSHGQSGNRFNQFYLAEFMAQHGYIVAAVEHVDDNNEEYDFTTLLAERAIDIDSCLNYLLDASNLKNSIDPLQIALSGHSLGATTIILFTENNAKKNQFFPVEINHCQSIKAMMLMAPAHADFFVTESLQSVDLPILLMASGKDELLPDDANSYLNHLCQVQYVEFAEAGHYVYLMICVQALKDQCRDICVDHGANRSLLHPLIQQHALRFFNECFNR